MNLSGDLRTYRRKIIFLIFILSDWLKGKNANIRTSQNYFNRKIHLTKKLASYGVTLVIKITEIRKKLIDFIQVETTNTISFNLKRELFLWDSKCHNILGTQTFILLNCSLIFSTGVASLFTKTRERGTDL